jgi:carbonic anhydrase
MQSDDVATVVSRKIALLKKGNEESGLSKETIQKMSGTQSPMIAILTCSDARIDPNRVFGLDIGEAFVVRVAGNSAIDKTVIGSLEYAVEHLRVNVILVLGHTNCGAATAAKTDRIENDNIEMIVKDLRAARERLPPEESENVDAIAEENVRAQKRILCQRSALIDELVTSGKLSIICAVLGLSNGRARFL